MNRKIKIDTFFAVALLTSCVLELVPEPLPALSRIAMAGCAGLAAVFALAWMGRRSA